MANIHLIKKKYELLCEKKSDTNEHLPTLFKYASCCESVIECGVRGCVSSWALLYGILNNKKENKCLLLNDISTCNIDELLNLASGLDVEIRSEWISNLELNLSQNYDMVFIDTWHVYGQLKRELTKFSKLINKYIIMHDTTIDEIQSESVRNNHNISKKMEDFHFSYDEVTVGLKKAIDEFLLENSEWKLLEKFTNNNGLTVLEKR